MKYRFGFVNYFDTRDAEDAIKGYHNFELDGRKLNVEWSKSERNNSDRNSTQRDSQVCNNCGRKGHWDKDCFRKRDSGRRESGRGDVPDFVDLVSKCGTDDQREIQRNYAGLGNVMLRDREKSDTIALNSFNNFIKSLLILNYTRRRDVVLDLCSGKGGDLNKWKNSKISKCVMVDLVEKSVRDAQKRFGEKKFYFDVKFRVADCFNVSLQNELDNIGWDYDIVSCQFAAHYAFQSEQMTRDFLSNVSHRLKVDGNFIVTTTNSDSLLEMLKLSDKNTFGNNYYNVEFEEKYDTFPEFGTRYFFTLVGAVERVPEYVVLPETFQRIAAEYNLALIKTEPFMTYYESNLDQNKDLYKIIMRDNQLREEFYEIINLYRVYIFQKTETPQ
jgi:mRNA (guanine-N7-)-methyltransferase